MLYPCTCGFITQFYLPVLGIRCLKKKRKPNEYSLGQDTVIQVTVMGSLNIEAVLRVPALER